MRLSIFEASRPAAAVEMEWMIEKKRGKGEIFVKMALFLQRFSRFSSFSSEKHPRCFPSSKNSNLTWASAAVPKARNARLEVLGVRLEAGVGSGEVLEVALELGCC